MSDTERGGENETRTCKAMPDSNGARNGGANMARDKLPQTTLLLPEGVGHASMSSDVT